MYREKRLISYGTWFRIMPRQEKFKLLRVKVDVPNSLDRLWALDVKKSSVRPPRELLARLRDLLDRMGAPSRTLLRKRGRRMRTGGDFEPLWVRRKRESRICWEINRDHPVVRKILEQVGEQNGHLITKLLDLTQENIPVSEIYSEMTQDSKQVALLDLVDSELERSLFRIFEIYSEILSLGKEDAVKKVLETAPFHNNQNKCRRVLEDFLDRVDEEDGDRVEWIGRKDGDNGTKDAS